MVPESPTRTTAYPHVSMSTSPATLATYRLPAPTFHPEHISSTMRPLWKAMANNRWRDAREELPTASAATEGDQAALFAARAIIERALGNGTATQRWLSRSLDIVPEQWLALRLKCDILARRQQFEAAYDLLASQDADAPAHGGWDIPLSVADYHTALASWAFRQNDRPLAISHLKSAYPKLVEMPRALLQDLFRLSVNTMDKQTARDSAAALISILPYAAADGVLQALVDRGWEEDALSLYLSLDDSDAPADALRRRIVGLCLRTGAVDQARQYHTSI